MHPLPHLAIARRPLSRVLASAVLVCAPFAASAATFVPAQPKAFEPIHVVESINGCTGVDSVRFDGTRIVVNFEPTFLCNGVPPPPQPVSIPLGRLPAGTWTVVFASNGTINATTQSTLIVADNGWYRTSESAMHPVMDISGFWYFDNFPANGVTFALTPDGVLAGLMFNYATDRSPVWLSLQSGQQAFFGHWSGTVYRTTAGGLSGGGQPGDPFYSIEGSVDLQFTDAYSAQLCVNTPGGNPPPAAICYSLHRFPFY